jgi:hypothetical protein
LIPVGGDLPVRGELQGTWQSAQPMSDFAERIRDARVSTRPLELAADPVAEQSAEPSPSPPLTAVPPPGPSAEELQTLQRRVDELARKIDDLNAELLQEFARVPGAASEFPRTVAALAGELAERAQRSA